MTEMKDLLYQGRDLVQVYGDRIVLNVPHIEIVRGEVLALTGPNGCGKSTLLRILAFLERPASGVLQYGGGGNGRKQVTLLLQDPYLLRMSVFSNVVMGLRLRNDAASVDMVFEQSMRAVGFDRPWDFARRGPGELSGGERQRIALASRLALRPMVLLLDEPTANVDAASARDMVQAVSTCRREGATVVCSTHDPALIHTLGAREVQLGRRWDETF